ncbi:MAG: hypothetical protein ACRDKH_07055, partial [Solirubrobacterales bacterium]
AEPPRRGFVDTGVGLRPLLPAGVLVVAALAAGLALGTKLNLLAPFGLLTLGLIAVAVPGRRLWTAAVWAGCSLITGGFWFARNLVEAGNPLPWIDAGPLPGPDQFDIDIRDPHTVADYLTDFSVITDEFFPKLNDSFGFLWPVVLAAVIAGFALAIFRGRTSMVRMLGVVAILSGITYLFTPLTAAGPEGSPTAFDVNLRYASPALALGAMLLAIDPGLSRDRAQPWLLAALGALFAVGLFSGAESVWERDYALGGIVLALGVIAVPAGLALAAQRGAPLIAVATAAALAVGIAIGVGWAKDDRYLDDRYRAATAPSDFPEGIRAALEWFNEEEPTDSRIAVVGGRPGFKQYVFYGDDLSNHVQYVAHEGDHGSFTPITTDPRDELDRGACAEWISSLADGDYDYAVVGPDQRALAQSPVESVWTASAGGRSLVEEDMTTVFELPQDLDAAACERLSPVPPGAGNRAGSAPERRSPE